MIVLPGVSALVKVWKLALKYRPMPEPVAAAEKSAGDNGEMVIVKLALLTPLVVTTTPAVVPATSNGNCALICWAETKYKGAATPPILTLVVPRLVGSGTLVAAVVPAAKFVPKMEMRHPG